AAAGGVAADADQGVQRGEAARPGRPRVLRRGGDREGRRRLTEIGRPRVAARGLRFYVRVGVSVRAQRGARRWSSMASGIFARLGNLWKGFVNLWISDIEKEHPEIAYENAINSMIEKYAQL